MPPPEPARGVPLRSSYRLSVHERLLVLSAGHLARLHSPTFFARGGPRYQELFRPGIGPEAARLFWPTLVCFMSSTSCCSACSVGISFIPLHLLTLSHHAWR